MIALLIFGSLGAWWFTGPLGYDDLSPPGGITPHLGLWYAPSFLFMIVIYANAINITDGLDGLAGGLLLFNYGVYAIITYERNLNILCALCVIIIGALIAFLWYNIKPAKFYM